MARHANQLFALAADLMLAPSVILLRMPLLAAEARGGDLHQAETLRAWSEKAGALAEGAVAAQLSFVRSAVQFWPEVLAGRAPSILNGVAAERSFRAALHPVRKRLRSNLKRLSPRP